MKTFEQYCNEILTIVMNNVKNGISGSTTADTLVNEYGYEREEALTLITYTMVILHRANVL